jgi:hypothetical protein
MLTVLFVETGENGSYPKEVIPTVLGLTLN